MVLKKLPSALKRSFLGLGEGGQTSPNIESAQGGLPLNDHWLNLPFEVLLIRFSRPRQRLGNMLEENYDIFFKFGKTPATAASASLVLFSWKKSFFCFIFSLDEISLCC